jgi:hypothetical protein
MREMNEETEMMLLKELKRQANFLGTRVIPYSFCLKSFEKYYCINKPILADLLKLLEKKGKIRMIAFVGVELKEDEEYEDLEKRRVVKV